MIGSYDIEYEKSQQHERPTQLSKVKTLCSIEDRSERNKGGNICKFGIPRNIHAFPRVLMLSPDPREHNEAAKKHEVREVSVHQTVRNTKNKNRRKRRMSGNTGYAIGLRCTASHHRTRRSR